MLTDFQILEIAKRMDIPLERCCFKSELTEEKLVYNKGYILNMEDEFNSEGERNDGTHWTAFYVKKTPNGTIQPIYFDSYGVDCPEIVKTYIGLAHVPYTTKDIQSLLGEVCGYFCLAFLYWITSYYDKTGDLYTDVDSFQDLFDDLNIEKDFKKNEFVLKHFFRSSSPSKRKPIEVI
jgi:hypothetical protein